MSLLRESPPQVHGPRGVFLMITAARSSRSSAVSDVSGGSAARVRLTLDPRQTVRIDSAENKSLNLQCGECTDTLAIVDNSTLVASRTGLLESLLGC